MRAAVGASRWQIIRQLLIESFVLALFGGGLGLCLAAWGRDLLVALAPPGVPRFQNITLSGWVLVFSLGLSLVTSILFGLWPAWHSSRANIQLALKSGGHSSSETAGAKRSRDLLVVAEVALTLILRPSGITGGREFSLRWLEAARLRRVLAAARPREEGS